MSNKTTGEIISSIRREKGLTQKDLAEKLSVTDKAVSKWERDIALPDINTLPKLADILNITIEELIAAKPQKTNDHKKVDFFIDLILKSIPLAMGVAVIITSILNELSIQSGFTMLGIGVFFLSLLFLAYEAGYDGLSSMFL